MPTLFDPFVLGAMTLANRIVMAPLTRDRAGPGQVPTPLMAEYYRQRASAGLIVTEASQICAEGQGYLDTPGIYNAAHVAGWTATEWQLYLELVPRPASPALCRELDARFALTAGTNHDVLVSWLTLALGAGELGVVDRVEQVVTTVGRMSTCGRCTPGWPRCRAPATARARCSPRPAPATTRSRGRWSRASCATPARDGRGPAGQAATSPSPSKAYPNPVVNQVRIYLEDVTTPPAAGEVQILDQVGRAYPVRASWHAHAQELEVDLADLDRGLYFIRAATSTALRTIKVMKSTE